MQIEVKVSELVKRLQRANDVIASKLAMEILGYVKIDIVSADRATMTANDLGAAIVQDLAITVVSQDYESFMLPATKALMFAAELPKDAILTITTDGENPIKFKATKFKATIPYMTSADFRVNEIAPESNIKVGTSALNKLIGRVEAAAPSKEQKGSTASVLIEGDGKTLQAVATDGFRIAIATAAEGTSGEAFSIQLPKSMLGVLKNISGDTISFAKSETNFFFRTATELVIVSRPTTKFPDWKKLLNSAKYVTSATVAVPMFLSAVKLASVTSDQKRPSVIIETQEKGLLITTNSAEGVAASEVDATFGEQSAPNKVRLNHAFIYDFLGSADGTALIQMGTSKSLVRFDNGNDFIYLIMPLLMEAPKEEKAA